MPDIFAKIISVDWERALFAYDTHVPGFVSVALTASGEPAREWRSEEASGTGRLELNNLTANTCYLGKFTWLDGESKFSFRTLPEPKGSLIGAYSVVADPHLSCKKENRKGRFFLESAMLFQDVVEQCNNLDSDFVLLLGDITNSGDETEYARANRILSQLQMPYFMVAGNHDLDGNGKKEALWHSCFGKFECSMETQYGLFLGLDTSRGQLTSSSAEMLKNALLRKKQLIVFTHYQLFENDHINRGRNHKTITNTEVYKILLDKLLETRAIIYAGHQNVPSVQVCGKSYQVNLPQPVQYPCGFTFVRHYSNGFYHTFIPINSEVLRQYSLRASNQAAGFYNESQWESAYREGKCLNQLNFIIEGKNHAPNTALNKHLSIRNGSSRKKTAAVS